MNPSILQKLKNLIGQNRPDLMRAMKRGFVLFPSDHPCLIRIPNVHKWNSASAKLMPFNVREDCVNAEQESAAAVVQSKKSTFQRRVLKCLADGCNVKISNNRMDRMRAHVEKHHSAEREAIMTKVLQVYPPFRPKSTAFYVCDVCQVKRTGCAQKLAVHRTSLKHLRKEFSDPEQVLIARKERLAQFVKK